jgi:gluconolactonase
VQPGPTHTERIVEILIRPGSVPVDRDGEVVHTHLGHWNSSHTLDAARDVGRRRANAALADRSEPSVEHLDIRRWIAPQGKAAARQAARHRRTAISKEDPAIDTIEARFEVIDERFRSVNGDGRVERLHTGCRWTEGPCYVPAGRYLVFSDIPNDRMLRWDETTGTVGVFRQPAGYANGHTLDRQGRLVSCEQGHRRVTRTEHDGSITVLAERYDGKRLNSPNDVVERVDGSIWFTDPGYGIDSDYEGHRAASEIGACHVYRTDPGSGEVRVVADDFVRPNGLAFSLDERQLYVGDSRAKHIRRFDVADDGTLRGGEVFAECGAGTFDGIRLDHAGRVWAAAGDGLHCFDPDGTLIGKLHIPEVVANLTFGGPKRNDLFICASTSLYAIRVNFNGARYPR